MEESEAHELADVNFFTDLVINESMTNGLLMFRLAESRIDIIVAEKIAMALMEEDFIDLELEPLDGEGDDDEMFEDDFDDDYY